MPGGGGTAAASIPDPPMDSPSRRPETVRSSPFGTRSWGRLRRIRRRRGERGLTLIELLIIMAVIGVLSTIALLLYNDFTYSAQIARATADIAILEGEISTFEMANLRLPDNLGEIGRASLLDPWGNPYQYLNFA